MAHHRGNFFLFFSHLFCCTNDFLPFFLLFLLYISPSLLLWCYQAAQITHVVGERMKKLAEDAEREKALKDVANATARDKGKAAEVAEKKAQSSEKARLLAERKLADMKAKLGKQS